ncbi:RluA family pseudouridine synthase [Chelatococcus reniformis]|uniref:RluA family pseudouridine synthase n=1 Tax=Chelatococcus reniformis TaxID=1494448 RepID=UPI0027E501FE|nr:RluA family pseudouridine synthase [Chelatococcus reniformis]
MGEEDEGVGGEQHTVVAAADGRLDRILAAALPELSRTRLQQLVRAGAVRIGAGLADTPSLKIAAGETIALIVPPPSPAAPAGEAIPLTVLYEDDELLVVDKPAGMVVHPAAGHHTGTLVNALIAHCGASLSGIGGVRRPGIVHRLDKDTSGLMVVAKTDRAHAALSRQFADHGRTGPLERAYLALAWGGLPVGGLSIDRPLARSTRNREKIAVAPPGQGREAITHVEVGAIWPASQEPVVSLLRCELETGRTHQIRVHLASLGHPLLGDPLYGGGFRTKAALLPSVARECLVALGRQALHAGVLGFAHPTTGEALSFTSEPPGDLAALAQSLGFDTRSLLQR